MKVAELKAMTVEELEAKWLKLERVIKTHPQKSMRARACNTRYIIAAEISRRK